MKRQPAKDTPTIEAFVAEWMAEFLPSWSIDTLLCYPHLAIVMGRYVCVKLHRPATRDAISEVCRVAINSRKRGKIRLAGGGNRRPVAKKGTKGLSDRGTE